MKTLTKKILIIGFICALLTPFAYSQDGDHIRGGRFTKIIEYNQLVLGNTYNFNSKGDTEKRLFGDFNAPVEFFYSSGGGVSGFRIIRDTLKLSYFLEIKYISNYKEAWAEASSKYPTKGVSSIATTPEDTLDKISVQNGENIKTVAELRIQLFKVETRSFPISDQFAERLYEKMVSVIDNFKARGVPPFILDGYLVTFRATVDDNELWTLKIHMPKGNALKWSDICGQIITETLATEKIDESKYIKILDEFN